MMDQRGFSPILIILTVVGIVGLVGGAYYLGMQNQKPLIQNTNTQNTQLINSPAQLSTTPPTSNSLKTGNSSFTSDELKISFSYPSKIGVASENPASKGKGGSAIKGEEWWRIDFDKTGFEPGYYEVSAGTSNYAPSSWEGSPHWFNTKLSNTDTADSVKQKLIAAKYSVVRVKPITSQKDVPAFEVYFLNCYGGCMLERIYLVPYTHQRYNNINVLTVIKNINAGTELRASSESELKEKYDKFLQDTVKLANIEIQKIDNAQDDITTKEIVEGQDLIFNSLTF